MFIKIQSQIGTKSLFCNGQMYLILTTENSIKVVRLSMYSLIYLICQCQHCLFLLAFLFLCWNFLLKFPFCCFLTPTPFSSCCSVYIHTNPLTYLISALFHCLQCSPNLFCSSHKLSEFISFQSASIMNLVLTTNKSESSKMERTLHYFAAHQIKKASSVVVTEML